MATARTTTKKAMMMMTGQRVQDADSKGHVATLLTTFCLEQTSNGLQKRR